MSGRGTRSKKLPPRIKNSAGRGKEKEPACTSIIPVSRVTNNPRLIETLKFPTAEAKEKFRTRFAIRRLHVERAVNFSDLSTDPFSIIPHIFQSRGWEYFSRAPGTVYRDPVKEFYCNFVSFSRDPLCLISWVRGVCISVTPELLSELTGIPRVHDPGYPFSSLDTPSKETMGNAFSSFPVDAPGCRWPCGHNTYTTGSMAPHVALLSRIMLQNIYPLAHHSDITVVRAQFLFALLTGVSIDFCSFALDVMWEVSQSSSPTIAFPGLISSILDAHQVPLFSVEPIESPQGIFSQQTVHRSKAQTKRRRPYDSSSDEPAAASVPHSSSAATPATLEGVMTLLQSIMQTQEGVMMQLQSMQSSFGTQLTHIKEHLASLSGVSIQPPSTQPPVSNRNAAARSSSPNDADDHDSGSAADSAQCDSSDDGGDNDSGDEARTKRRHDV